ncbi:MAG: flagellar basal body-associated FliL family protein [Pseudomonadota bacterium]
MIRLLLPVLLLLIGTGAGVGAGLFLGGSAPASGDAEHDTHAAADDEHGSDDHDEDHGAEHGHGETSSEGLEYVRLNNQFIVPIVHHGSVRSLVVMSLTLEIEAGANSLVFRLEPRLRDAFLQVMFAHANSGGFDGSFTEAAAMAPLREALTEAAHGVLADEVHDVLIVDITRQDA